MAKTVTPEKLSEEIMKKIAELQGSYQQNSLQMGDIVFERQRLDKAIIQLDDASVKLGEAREQLTQTEATIIGEIKEKYGEGTINLQTGEFVKT